MSPYSLKYQQLKIVKILLDKYKDNCNNIVKKQYYLQNKGIKKCY